MDSQESFGKRQRLSSLQLAIRPADCLGMNKPTITFKGLILMIKNSGITKNNMIATDTIEVKSKGMRKELQALSIRVSYIATALQRWQ